MRTRWSLIAFAVLWLGATSAYAQVVASNPPNLDFNAIASAFSHHEWVLLGALLIYGLTTLAKQGWLGAWLQRVIPKRYIPLIAPTLGVLGLTTSEIIGHTPWPQAIFDGLSAGVLAVFGHETIVESARGGKEIVPQRAGRRPPANGKEDGAVDVRISSAPPPRNELMAALYAVASGALLVLALSAATVRCTPAERQEAQTITDWVLKGSQLACIEATQFVTTPEVAAACGIDLKVAPDLQAFIDSLLAQKAAAQRAGFKWHVTTAPDGGVSFELLRPAPAAHAY